MDPLVRPLPTPCIAHTHRYGACNVTNLNMERRKRGREGWGGEGCHMPWLGQDMH